MNQAQKKFLEKAIDLGFNKKHPLFKGIFIIPQRKLHDSGYRMMYVIGHTDYNKTKNDYDYYLVGTYSDVIDLQPIFGKYLQRNYDMCDFHLDINKNGIIHIWTNSEKYIQCTCPYVSACMFEVVDKK